MGQALYRKYRSKNLSEIIGQEHITHALEQALKTKRVSHAYLFTGPRGIGKTSIARILAYEVNGLPYDETSTHLDIIEIDAASNRRIDEVRDLREKVHITPTSAKYKVYIIDEVHMLTREAFNALLKTLEEPPEHVIFILATTEAHKLPETIISRTQHFTFKPISIEKITKHLKAIAKTEKISIDDAALELIATHGNGSFRDSISLLDQVSNNASAVTKDTIQNILGIAPDEVVATILDATFSKNSKKLVLLLQDLRIQGVEPSILSRQLAHKIRNDIVHNHTKDIATSLRLLEKLIEVPASNDSHAMLEVLLLQEVFANTQQQVTTASEPPKSKPSPTTKKREEKPLQISEEVPQSDTKITKQPEPKPISSKTNTPIDPANWADVLDNIKQNHNTLYGLLRMAKPEIKDNVVTLKLAFAFHQKRLNEPKNKTIIANAIHEITGSMPEIICELAEKDMQETSDNTGQTKESGSIGTISNIFGGAELLES